jgi:hypothetical protein
MTMGVPNGRLKYVFKFQRQLNNKEVRREWTCLKNKMFEKKSLKALDPIYSFFFVRFEWPKKIWVH